MKSMQNLLLVALLLASQTGLSESQQDVVTTEKTGEDTFLVTLKSTTIFDVPTAATKIRIVANDLCGDKKASLEKYRFEKNETVEGDGSNDWFQMEQNVRCQDSTNQPKTARTPLLKTEAAENAVREKVSSLSKDYFERLYANMGDNAEAALAARSKRSSSDKSAIFETVEGTPVNINFYRISVYDNLPSSPAEGIYAAVDYDNRIGNVAHHCGYLIWHSYDATDFSLGRVETGTLPEELLKKIPDDQLPSVLKQLRCETP